MLPIFSFSHCSFISKRSIELFARSSIKYSQTKEAQKINQQLSLRLENTLLEYGVEGNIISFKSGPIVTLFEFVPKAGIKASKVVGLSDDIARAMSSLSARISSQPGKTSLGIEIPNTKREDVFFGDLINDNVFLDKMFHYVNENHTWSKRIDSFKLNIDKI